MRRRGDREYTLARKRLWGVETQIEIARSNHYALVNSTIFVALGKLLQ